jgi:nicotianamine synthase
MDNEILKLHKQVLKLENFEPGKRVNELFSDLVSIATSFNNFSKRTLRDVMQDLQKAAADAEVEMEKFWAKKISESGSPKKELEDFWYYKNYLDLTKLEYGSLSLCAKHGNHHKILFVGSGPLPLSGIILSLVYKCEVTVLDINEESLEMSRKLVKSLGLKNFNFIHADAFTFKDYDKFDVVFVAAMVQGFKKTKADLVNYIATKIKKNTHVLVRSAFHNRELLYKKFDPKKVVGLKPILEVRPKNEIVNSFHVFEK